MTRSILFAAALVAATGLVAIGATAQDRATPEQASAQVSTQSPITLAGVAATLEGDGYTIHEIEFEHGRHEVEMIDASGRRVEARLDPVTGELLPYRDRGSDDDDRRYDRDDD